MANILQSEWNGDDEEHHAAFGEHIDIPEDFRYEINQIRNNDPEFKSFRMDCFNSSFDDFDDVKDLSSIAWELLGRYIAKNYHLKRIHFEYLHLTDENMSNLFRHLTMSRSLEDLDLSGNNFGLKGIQSMVPFLKNSPNLKKLNMNANGNINTECFNLLFSALDGGSITDLSADYCNIDYISALGNNSLPQLKHLGLSNNNIQNCSPLEKYTSLETLWLSYNRIEKEGCKSLAKLLQNPRSCLKHLFLHSNVISGEAAEILAQSIKNNTTLEKLVLGGNSNNFGKVGLRSFLRVLNDVSSIERTYNSNHALSTLNCASSLESCATWTHVSSAISVNVKNSGNSHATGRSKVIATQLNSIARMELCRLQGIDYSYSKLFADIDPILLPDVLAIVGGEHGQSELYHVLIATVAGLVSTVNKKACIKERIAENAMAIAPLNAEYARESAALAAKHLHLQNELTSMGSKEVNDTVGIDVDIGLRGKKRCRIGLSN